MESLATLRIAMAAQLFIYGTGGHAAEIAAFLRSTPAFAARPLTGFIDDADGSPNIFCGLPVICFSEASQSKAERSVIVAIGEPGIRQTIVKKCKANEFRFPSLVPEGVSFGTIECKDGCVVFPSAQLTTNISIGSHVHINIGATISHDVVCESFVTISPGATVCGNVRIKEGAFIGAGATIINGTPRHPLTIGEGSTVGAGACVTEDVQRHTTVVGIPARQVSRKAHSTC